MRMLDQPDWQKLLKLIGEDAASALSAVFGGGRMYVPKFIGAHHPISEAVGPKAAAIIAAEYGGGHIDIPMSLGKRAQIVQLIEGGKSVPEICRRVGVSRRHVFYVKNELGGGEGRSGRRDQLDLF